MSYDKDFVPKTFQVLSTNQDNLKKAQDERIKVQKELVALVQEATAILGQIHSLGSEAEAKLKDIHEKEKKKLVEFSEAMKTELHKKNVWQEELAKALVYAVTKKVPESETKALFDLEKLPFLKEILNSGSVAAEEDDQDMDLLLVDWKDIVFEKDGEIGEGAFGKVSKAKCKGVDVAVKELKATDIVARETFKRECQLLSKIPHENVLQFIAACAEEKGEDGKPHFALITEYASNKSLADHVKPCAPGTLPEFSLAQKVHLLQEIATGMQFLAQNKIIHLDLKPANILLDEYWHVRIADFGMSKITGKKETDFAGLVANRQVGGTPLYMAPELLPGAASATAPDEKCDVFSFGILAWETFVQQEPYPKEVKANIDTLAKAVRDGDRPLKYVKDNEITKMDSVQAFLKSCWDTDPAKRVHFSALLVEDSSNPWQKILAEELSGQSVQTGKLWQECLSEYQKKYSKTDNAAEWEFFKNKIDKIFSVSLTPNHHDALLTILEVDMEAKPALVTSDKWLAFVQWFGPFDRGTLVKSIDTLISILNEPWFFGPMSATEAEYRLCFEAPGTFLVRFSATQRSKFSFSWVEKESKGKNATTIIRHARLCQKAALLEGNVLAFTKILKKKCGSARPCPERPAKYRVESKKSK